MTPPVRRYPFEHGLIAVTLLLSVAGFWDIYLGVRAAPAAHHHLHAVTVFVWLFLLRYQLGLVGSRRYAAHAAVGTAVLAIGPLLFASSALLTVHSAAKGVASGQGDFLIVQNVVTTLTLGLLIALAFVLRKRRKLHGSLILSTTILFMVIATFFALISFAPPFRIEGPETFYRFGLAGMAAQGVGLAAGLLFFARDVRHGWPFLLAGASFPLSQLLKSALTRNDLIDPLTAAVGAVGEAYAFVGGMALLLAILLAAGIRPAVSRAERRAPGDAKAPATDSSSAA